MTYSVYLGNRMTGVPKFNFPWFADAAAWLRTHGWEVKNPAEKDLESIPYEVMVTIPGYDEGDLPLYMRNSTFTMSNAMEWDLPAILDSDGIVLGDGWPVSTGARWERLVAEALDRDIWLLHGDNVTTPFELERDPEPTQLTTFLKGFGIGEHINAVLAEPVVADPTTEELIVALRDRLKNIPGKLAPFDQLWVGTAFGGRS